MAEPLTTLTTAQLLALLEQSPDMLGRYSPEGRIDWVSKQSLEILGYRSSEIQGRNAYEFIHRDDSDHMRVQQRQLLEGHGVLDAVCRALHRDGSVRWVHTTGRTIRDPEAGEVQELLCSTRDITRLRDAERQAASAESLAASLLRHLPAAAFVITPDHRYQFVNPFWEVSVGRKNEEVSGLPFSAIWPEDVARRFVELGERVLAAGEAAEIDQEIELEAGRRRFRSVRFPLRDGTGAITATAGVSLDITAAHELEQRGKEQEKMEAIARLAGGVAHEFNNALTVLLGYAQVIQQPATPAETARRYAAAIEASAKQSAALVEELLAFAGRARVSPRLLDLSEEVRLREPLLRSLTGPRILLALELLPAPVLADPSQIEMILKSFAAYAVKAMPGGGRLTLRVFPSGRHSVLEARDSSPGLPPLTRAQLFEPFHQLRVGAEPVSLRLGTAYGTVLQMGGDIDVATPDEGGVVFTIRIPAPGVD